MDCTPAAETDLKEDLAKKKKVFKNISNYAKILHDGGRLVPLARYEVNKWWTSVQQFPSVWNAMQGILSDKTSQLNRAAITVKYKLFVKNCWTPTPLVQI